MNRIVTSYPFDSQIVKGQQKVSRLDFLKTKLMVRLLMLGAFIVSLSLFYIWSRIQIVQIGYDLNDSILEQESLIDENKKLQMELAIMKSPERIKKFVVDDLKMSLPDPKNVIEVGP